VVPIDDPRALLEQSTRLVRDEQLRYAMGRQARQRALSFSIGAAVQRWAEALEEASKSSD
jgi:glycosyltransferase involved in cell wall biosynthesis